METILAQPAILPPIVNLRIMTNNIPKKESRNESKPDQTDKFSGASEKLIKPSKEYLNKLQKLQDDSPATRSLFS